MDVFGNEGYNGGEQCSKTYEGARGGGKLCCILFVALAEVFILAAGL